VPALIRCVTCDGQEASANVAFSPTGVIFIIFFVKIGQNVYGHDTASSITGQCHRACCGIQTLSLSKRQITPCPEKNGTTLFLRITLPNAGQFSKIFHQQT